MSHIRITDPRRDLQRLNEAINQVDDLRAQIKKLRKEQSNIHAAINEVRESGEATSTNNLTVSWDGPNLKFTWTAGYVKDRDNHVHQIPAGSRTGLAATTRYWFGWNPVHQTMSVTTVLSDLTAIPNMLVLFRIKSGGAGTTATAGGGGQEFGAVDISGFKYEIL